MAIKIDLLPGYVGLRRKLKWALLGSFVVVTAVGSVLYLLLYQKQGQVEVAKQNLEMWKPIAAQATSVAKEASDKDASLANIQSTVLFFGDATQTGPRRAAVVDLIRRYIMPDALVSSIDISDGKNVTIVASVADSDDYSRLLINLRQGTMPNPPGSKPAPPLPYVWQTTPVASGVPGYPLPSIPIPALSGTDPTPKVFPLNISIAGTLLNDLAFTTPIAPGEAAAAAAPGAAGSGGGGSSSTGGATSTGTASPNPTGAPPGGK